MRMSKAEYRRILQYLQAEERAIVNKNTLARNQVTATEKDLAIIRDLLALFVREDV